MLFDGLGDRRRMTYRLSGVDIKHLHVFRAVVECRGFSNAQSVLNVGQSTISNQISQLEDRLGFRLCERGRIGFRLTPKGEKVYEELLRLFKAHEGFQNATSELKGRLSGFLNIALIDNVVSDPVCPIVGALNRFNRRDHDVTLQIEIMTPGKIELAVLEADMDLAVGTFDHQLPGLQYKKIYVESNQLLCGVDHPLFGVDDPDQIRELVTASRKVTRSYLDRRDIFSLGGGHAAKIAMVQHLEAAAILILAGGHIGFLPEHYAQTWVRHTEMKPILPAEYRYTSDFYILTRRSRRKSLIMKSFLEDLDATLKDPHPGLHVVTDGAMSL